MKSAGFALILTSILWGTTGTAASFFSADVSPLAIGACTMAIGGLLLFAVSARTAIMAIRDRAALPWLLLGAVGVFVYPLAFYSAMDLAGVAIGNVVALGSGPVFAAAFEWLWERHPVTRRAALSIVVAIVGVVVLGIFGHRDAAGSSSGNVPLGVALGLLAGCAYALYTYSSTRAIGLGHRGSAVMGSTFGLGGIALVPVLIVAGAPLLGSGQNIAIAGYLALGPMFLAYVLFGRALGSLRSSTVTTITLLEPVVATVLAIVVVGERLSPAGWVGIALILAAIGALVTARPAEKIHGRP